jgi:hypothetical protein
VKTLQYPPSERKMKFLLAFYKIAYKLGKPFNIPLQRACSSFPKATCDSKKIVSKAPCDSENCFETKESPYNVGFGTILELVKCLQRSKQKLYINIYIRNTNNTRDPTICSKASNSEKGTKGKSATAEMPAEAGMQAVAGTPATSNSKDDSNSIMDNTLGTPAKAGTLAK